MNIKIIAESKSNQFELSLSDNFVCCSNMRTEGRCEDEKRQVAKI